MNPRDDRDPVSPSEQQPVAAEGHEEAAGCSPADLVAGGPHPASMLGMAGIGGRRKADQGGGRPVTPWPPAVRWCR
jgi:hypothetical protein